MLTKGIIQRIDLPWEPGEWIDISPLGFRAIRRAREVRTLEQIKLFSAVQSVSSDATTQAMQSAAEQIKQDLTPEAEAEKAAALEADKKRKAADLNEYDVPTLLHEGIVAWSYDEKITPAAIDTLDEVTAEYVAQHLIPQPEDAEERKNG